MALHMLRSVCIWLPHSTSSPLLEGQSGPAEKRRVSGPKDAAPTRSQKKIVSFQISLCPTVPEETNPKQLLFSLSVFKTWRQKCSEFKGIRLDFDTKWTSKIHPEHPWNTPVTYTHIPDWQFEGDFVWLEISCVYLCDLQEGLLLGPSCWRADWRTMPWLPDIFQYSNYLPSSFALTNSFSSPSLFPSFPLFHPQLLVLSQSLFPNSLIPAHKTLDSSFCH